jgi:hypothetical protein
VPNSARLPVLTGNLNHPRPVLVTAQPRRKLAPDARPRKLEPLG